MSNFKQITSKIPSGREDSEPQGRVLQKVGRKNRKRRRNRISEEKCEPAQRQ